MDTPHLAAQRRRRVLVAGVAGAVAAILLFVAAVSMAPQVRARACLDASQLSGRLAVLPAWQALCGPEGPKCVETVMRDLLRLYIFTTVCDPPMKFDAKTVGTTMPFNPETATPVDDKIKAGKKCVVICPALYSADGLLKAKAQVLAADYL